MSIVRQRRYNTNFNITFSEGYRCDQQQADWIAVTGVPGLNLNVLMKRTAGGFGDNNI